jgi:hypothetical protein
MLETMLSKIDDFKAQEESQQSESQILDSVVAEDAVLLLEKDLSEAFFSMARCVLSIPMDEKAPHSARHDQVGCTEKIVILAARMSTRFINGGVMRLSGAFKGNYQLFNEFPHKVDLRERQYLALFISTLLRCNIDDFGDAGFSLCEIWISSLTKPRTFVKYEIELGKELLRHGMTFVPETVAGISVQPDYHTNRDLLDYAISSMRKSVREAGPSLRGVLVTEFSSALKLSMELIKGNLKEVMGTPQEHGSYVVFVQEVISLIKTHASDICAVDNYFCQISKEYSPSAEDPQLKVANLKSYGLRLHDGDSRIGQPLFHLLFNNAKFSMLNDKLTEEVHMLAKGMGDCGIKTFILSKMLPAIVRASFAEHDAFPLLDIYAGAFELCFARKSVPLELFANDLAAVCTLTQAMLSGMEKWHKDGGILMASQIHVMRQVIGLGNLLWPSIYILSTSSLKTEAWTALWDLLGDLGAVNTGCEAYLRNTNEQQLANAGVQADDFLGGIPKAQGKECRFDSDVVNFAENIVQDVRKNWKLSGDKMTIHIPGQSKGSAMTAPFETFGGWKLEDAIKDLEEGTQEWNWWWRKANGVSCFKHSESVVF